jgi:hypothetical protein
LGSWVKGLSSPILRFPLGKLLVKLKAEGELALAKPFKDWAFALLPCGMVLLLAVRTLLGVVLFVAVLRVVFS